ncbi:MAG: orotidine-5'-phosphate decarboxylase [Bryobacteraceae bacterium]
MSTSSSAAAPPSGATPASTSIDARDRLILALDLPDIDQSRQMVERLEGVVSFYKIGLALQLAPGVEAFVRSLIDQGKKVFLDYKYYDVPETLRKAVSRASTLGVSFLTIHGSSSLIRGAVEGRGDSALKLFTVTVLTAMDAGDIAELGYTNHSVEELVLFRARKALEAGCDGVIASGLEVEKIKAVTGDRLLVITPGIRPDDYPGDDQKRRVTASGAIQAGADYLVIGRPIADAPDPVAAARAFLDEMQQAFGARATA